jgi:hypothetical protein
MKIGAKVEKVSLYRQSLPGQEPVVTLWPSLGLEVKVGHQLAWIPPLHSGLPA